MMADFIRLFGGLAARLYPAGIIAPSPLV